MTMRAKTLADVGRLIGNGHERVTIDLARGRRITFIVEPDLDTVPGDYDTYSDADIQRWHNDDWRFVGMAAQYDDDMTEAENMRAAIWGVELGRTDDQTEHLADIARSLTEELLTGMRSAVSALTMLLKRPAGPLPAVPDDFPVKVLGPNDSAEKRACCGTCGREWDDAIVTEWTPAPSARCPFEYFHATESE